MAMKIGMPAERLLSDPRLWATESGVVEVKCQFIFSVDEGVGVSVETTTTAGKDTKKDTHTKR